jgi:hypothetical protein
VNINDIGIWFQRLNFSLCHIESLILIQSINMTLFAYLFSRTFSVKEHWFSLATNQLIVFLACLF